MTIAEYNRSVDLYSDNIYRFVLKNLRDEDMARDVVQDTFERIWRKVTEVAFEKARAYLFTTAYRLMLEQIRRQKRFVPVDHVTYTSFSASSSEMDLKQILNTGLSRLPADQRAVIMLRDYEGYSYREIGEITGLNEAQVKVYIFRARVFLKNYIVNAENLV